jgi:FKBP-type peptidyl-prolyl cis-trans isomerase
MIYMKNKYLIHVAVAILVLGGLALYYQLNKQAVAKISSFEECKNAGYPVMESYPEQCRTPDGRNFINAQQANMNIDLQIQDLKVGSGLEAKEGSEVTVNYTGKLENGTKFDSSFDSNQPFSFTLGAGQVIEGWEKGILGMKVGGERKLTIPSQMAYGTQGIPNVIPSNATLIFEVELLEVK